MAQIKVGSTAGGSLILTDEVVTDYNVSSNVIDFSAGYNFDIEIISNIMIHGINLQIGQTGVIRLINYSHFTISYSDMLSNILRSTVSLGGITTLNYTIVSETEIAIDVFEINDSWSENISTADYILPNFNVTTEENSLRGVCFDTYGTKMYAIGTTTDKVYEYNLSTAGDVTTAIYSLSFKSVITEEDAPSTVTFNNDGSKMYIAGFNNSTVFEYNLSTPWFVPSAVYNSVNKVVTTEETTVGGITFNIDGTKMYLVGTIADTVFEYDLSTPWLVSSAVYNSVFLLLTSQTTVPTDIKFKSDGTKMYILGDGTTVYQYTLSTPWLVSSATYDSVTGSVNEDAASSAGMAFNIDGSKLYVAGTISDKIFEYDLSTPWLVSSAVYNIPTFYVGSQDATATGVTFNIDGSKMYVTGDVNNSVYRYDLGINWDITSAVYNSLYSATITTTPRDIAFNPDGSKMYICDYGGTSLIYEYNLGTNWNITTAVYNSVSIASEGAAPTGLVFKPDGTKMYLLSYATDFVYEYDLSISWDLSTAVYSLVSKGIGPEGSTPSGLDFSPDGTKMYLSTSSSDTIYEYDLSTPWLVSSAVYNGDSKLINIGATAPKGITFNTNGSTLYIVDGTTDNLYEYKI